MLYDMGAVDRGEGRLRRIFETGDAGWSSVWDDCFVVLSMIGAMCGTISNDERSCSSSRRRGDAQRTSRGQGSP